MSAWETRATASSRIEVAGDTAGGFVILPTGRRPKPARYEATSLQTIAAILKKGTAAAIDIHSIDARISLAGAQDPTRLSPMFPNDYGEQGDKNCSVIDTMRSKAALIN